MFRETKIDLSWSFTYVSRSETTKWTHGYHRCPAKFIPQLVEKLIDTYVTSNHANIYDPFFGSGTTIVSAISRSYMASGTDINGIVFLMAQILPQTRDKCTDRFSSTINATSKAYPTEYIVMGVKP